ncbi:MULTISPECIES: CC_3452 family protein [Henriciella]|jgi:hypothetical protein|uniref:Uncharacterized protein n=1 Tax=Henriciella pelagia TaxID=1977912 RepID=A0ABQ1JAH3_9PROT|nr:hypothetical protein [Henriciella pelagia]GGB64113.1 hypothetical protein GCM10011503_11120 [Henriciella pelagia]
MIRTASIAAAAAAFALPALAGTSFTAVLTKPVEKSDSIVAAKALWDCDGDKCVAELNRRTVTVRTCKKVASEVGELAAFSNEKESLSEADLAKCNEAAKR